MNWRDELDTLGSNVSDCCDELLGWLSRQRYFRRICEAEVELKKYISQREVQETSTSKTNIQRNHLYSSIHNVISTLIILPSSCFSQHLLLHRSFP